MSRKPAAREPAPRLRKEDSPLLNFVFSDAPRTLFEDKRFCIINKPAGMPVHPGGDEAENVEDYFYQWKTGKNGPWLAHRLDRDTAGCLVIALKKHALVAAQDLFADGRAEKTYWAVVKGVPRRSHGIVDLPLAKVTSFRQWEMTPAKEAPPAVTEWEVKGQAEGYAWLEFSPKTGRTHQIRAHAAAIGHPVLGDAIYGGGAGALHLLARRIFLPLDPPVMAEAPVPPHMREKLLSCGYVEK